jgi:hypothetical protein
LKAKGSDKEELKSVATQIVATDGSAQLAVGKIDAAKAADFIRIQQASATRRQLIQQQSLRNNKILQISTSREIWFGTRGSEV